MVTEYSVQEMEPDITVINLGGRLTLGNRLTQIESDATARIEQGSRKLLVEVSQLTYLDSAGLGALALLAGRAERAGGKLAVAGAAGRVREVIEIARLGQVLCLCDDVRAASDILGSVAGAPQA